MAHFEILKSRSSQAKVSDKTIPLSKRKKELNKGGMKSLHFIK